MDNPEVVVKTINSWKKTLVGGKPNKIAVPNLPETSGGRDYRIGFSNHISSSEPPSNIKGTYDRRLVDQVPSENR